jgi:hypothetical protein
MLAGMALVGATGCHLIFGPDCHEPAVHNPFPQLNRVAIAPFFNQSDEATVDGHKFALAYFAELQAVPGFEVVPVGVVEDVIIEHRVDLSHPSEARRLANILGVDAVVIGSVTDYTPYYPPHCGLRVEWYAANPGFHEIPPGYGLPWGTPEEEFIPQPLIFESEFALAKAQFATQTPACQRPPLDLPAQAGVVPHLTPAIDVPRQKAPADKGSKGSNPAGSDVKGRPADSDSKSSDGSGPSGVIRAVYEEQIAEEELPRASIAGTSSPSLQSDGNAAADTVGAIGAHGALPAGWPDQGAFVPPPPSRERPACCPNDGPVMTHTKIYQGTDADFAQALANYYHFRNDARFGGWQNYLQRSDDFIRFCCHMHICEMLTARGGGDQTQVAYRGCKCR